MVQTAMAPPSKSVKASNKFHFIPLISGRPVPVALGHGRFCGGGGGGGGGGGRRRARRRIAQGRKDGALIISESLYILV